MICTDGCHEDSRGVRFGPGESPGTGGRRAARRLRRRRDPGAGVAPRPPPERPHPRGRREGGVDLGDDEEPVHGHRHAHEAEGPRGPARAARSLRRSLPRNSQSPTLTRSAHARLLAHPHPQSHPAAHAERAHTHAVLPTRPAGSGRARRAPRGHAPPPPLDHGHASIAHFGLALLGAPALLRGAGSAARRVGRRAPAQHGSAPPLPPLLPATPSAASLTPRLIPTTTNNGPCSASKRPGTAGEW